VLSEYALEIGFALVALTLVGLAGWGLFLRRQWSRREDEISIGYSDLERALDDLRTEFQHSIETTSSRATRIGESVLAAVKPIEVALRDFSGRIANVESRANASDQMSAGLQSSLRAQECTSEQLARTVETMNSRLEVFQQDLTAVSGQLSTLRQMIEAMTARNDKHDEKLSTIEVSLGAVQGQMADLLERVNLGQTELTKPEETLTGTPIGVDSTPTEEEGYGRKWQNAPE
jgi:chromosome segregation ATPase